MLKLLEKHWPVISILLILAIVAAALLLPGFAQPLGAVSLILSIGMVILFSANKRVQAFRQGRLNRAGLVRKIGLDTLEILVTIGLVIVAARAAGGYASGAAASLWPGIGGLGAMIAGLVAGVAAGVAVGIAVRWVWGKLTGQKRPGAFQTS